MRECGECTLCCTVTRVPELKKAENYACNYCTDEGCSIYDERPVSCQGFRCSWLDGELGDDMRPDKLHVVLEKLPDVPVYLALLEPGFNITDEMTAALSEYTRKGISVVASNGSALLPKDVDAETVRKYVLDAAKQMGVI